jgi:ACS family sodium-dependent inorganic phosphate cotransporter
VQCVAVPIGGEADVPADQMQVVRRNSVFQLACSAAMMAAVARNSFTLLAVPISRELSLSIADIGAIQSALLTGYLVGQMPAGHWADKFGGPRTLMMGLLVWSVFGSATIAMPLVASPVLALLVLRGGLGLGQSVLMPAISATAAQNFSPAERGDKTSGIYACYSLGTVLGLVVTPLLAEAVGWMGCVVAVGLVGLAIAAYGLVTLRGSDMRPSRSSSASSSSSAARSSTTAAVLKNNTGILVLCCWTHFVIGFGFFTLQQWMPLFLNRYVQDLKVLGLIASLPWMGTALVSAGSGRLSLYLAKERGWSALRIRKFMQTASSLGIAACLLPLAVLPNVDALTAVLCMCFAVAFQGMCYPGYHSYVQDIFANEAGVVLALTNSWSIVAGVCGNILCGMTGDFSRVFGVVMSLYVVSAATFYFGARENK